MTVGVVAESSLGDVSSTSYIHTFLADFFLARLK